MVPAEYKSTSVVIENSGYELRAKGRVLQFDGWLKVQSKVQKKVTKIVTFLKLVSVKY